MKKILDREPGRQTEIDYMEKTSKMRQHDKRNAFPSLRRVTAPVLTGFALAGMALTGCGAGASQAADGTTQQAAAADEAATASTEAAFQGESIDTDANTGEAATEEAVLPEELEEGEEVLQRGDTDNISFHGTAPDLTVNLAENEAWILAIPAYGSTGVEYQSGVYLTKDSAGTDGAYLDAGNGSDLMDPNTVIHGSREEGGSLSGILAYGDAGYLTSHPYLYLYGESSISEYQVFAAYPKAHEDILMTYNCYDRDEFNQYIDGIYNQRNMQAVLNQDLEQQVLDTWCILTLQAEGADGEDFLVQAVPTGVENR